MSPIQLTCHRPHPHPLATTIPNQPPSQGDIWWAEAEHKRRSVLVVTRSEAIAVLTSIVVTPVTRTVRGIPTEIELDEDHGLGLVSAASFDNLQPIRRTFLTQRIGSLPHARQSICRTLGALADC